MISRCGILRAAACAGLFVGAAASAEAADSNALPGGTWASIAKLPDFSGVWEMTFGRGAFPGRQQISLTPKFDAMLKAYQAAAPEDTPASNCVPPGMPGIMGQPYPIEILYTPGQVTIVIEAYMQVRHIHTDGRKHPDDPDLTFNGHSIGHWEGDTLVVDSVGFTTDTPLEAMIGARHSDKMHIVERFHLADPNMLTITTTVDDSDALASPFARTVSYARHRDWTIAEYICQQNNRNFVDEKGKAGINLKR